MERETLLVRGCMVGLQTWTECKPAPTHQSAVSRLKRTMSTSLFQLAAWVGAKSRKDSWADE